MQSNKRLHPDTAQVYTTTYKSCALKRTAKFASREKKHYHQNEERYLPVHFLDHRYMYMYVYYALCEFKHPGYVQCTCYSYFETRKTVLYMCIREVNIISLLNNVLEHRLLWLKCHWKQYQILSGKSAPCLRVELYILVLHVYNIKGIP